jgi:galactose mutarotase-like enzyme
MTEVIELKDGSLKARLNIQKSQLFSLELDGTEFMWGGGKPEELKTEEEKLGWPNSEIMMFPIIGRAPDDQVTIDGKKFPMQQHGLARHLTSESYELTDRKVSYLQKYNADTEIQTKKGLCVFPFSFQIYREYVLRGQFLEHQIKIVNDSETSLPYAVGWHPAFRIPSKHSFVKRILTKYSIEKIKKESKTGALILEDTIEAQYVSDLGTVIVTSSWDLEHMQIWSPENQNLVCLESISAFSLSRANYVGELATAPGYKKIKPGESATFFVYVNPELSEERFWN